MSRIEPEPIDTVGPKDIADAFKMKDTLMSKRGIGYIAANGSNIKNNGETRVVGYTESGDGVGTRIKCADVKEVLGPVRKTNMS